MGARKTLETKYAAARESTLTFAAIWDPETGLETFAGGDLLGQQQPGGKDQSRLLRKKRAPAPPFVRRAEPEEDKSTVSSGKEPFAVLGSGRSHFIDIRTSKTYEHYLRSGPVPRSSSPPADCRTQDQCYFDWDYSAPRRRGASSPPPRLPPPQHTPTPGNQTPNSKLTFAAVWDPETGLSAYQNGVPVKHKKHSKWPSASSSMHTVMKLGGKPKRPSSPESGLNDIHGDVKPGLYLPRTSMPYQRSAVPSSTLEGNKGPWNYSCFDPLSQAPELPFQANRPFSPFERGQSPLSDTATCSEMLPMPEVYFNDETISIDDEGFFESAGSGHPDCDPHLPSRFSMTTTSTSTYVAIDAAAVRAVAHDQFLRSNESSEGSSSSSPTISPTTMKIKLLRAKSFPDRLPGSGPPNKGHLERKASDSAVPPIPSLSKVWKRSFSKRVQPDDKQWVLVEVQSVVTDRVVNT